LQKQNFGHESATTNWESLFEDNMPSATTFPTSPLKGTMCSPKAKLIIELDGSQHLEQQEYDQERTKYLNSLGYKVIRFWNIDVTNNIDGVILVILHALEDQNHEK